MKGAGIAFGLNEDSVMKAVARHVRILHFKHVLDLIYPVRSWKHDALKTAKGALLPKLDAIEWVAVKFNLSTLPIIWIFTYSTCL